MSDHDYEATVETEHGTFTFSGDDPRAVSAQAARMPVLMHRKQIETRTDLETSINRYMEEIAKQEDELKRKTKSLRRERNHRD